MNIQDFIKRDLIYITLCAIALLACLYTLLTTQEIVDTCNTHWESQLKTLNCLSFQERLNYSKGNQLYIQDIINVSISK